MRLVLSMIRCPDSVTPSDKEVVGVECSIGRGPGNDWVLPDPERRVSRHHCKLLFQSGQWQLIDLSTAGTFLNHSATRISESTACHLQNGDRIRLGPYEIGVAIEEIRQNPVWPETEQSISDNLIKTDSFFGKDQFDSIDDKTGTHGTSSGVFTQSEQIPGIHEALKPKKLIDEDWDKPPEEDWDKRPEVILPPQLPPPEEPPKTNATTNSKEDSLLGAFLTGVGMADAAPRDPRETLQRAGAALRATVSGLRAVLIALDLIRSEFRIERTEIQASGNNPLKFSTSDDDTIAGFLGAGRNTMSPADAIAKTLRSVRLHELATMTAMQAAAGALLAQFDPATIMRQTDQGGFAVLPGQHKVRAWDAFSAAHARVSQSLSDNFDSVFGRAFARAYEQAIDELSAQRDPP